MSYIEINDYKHRIQDKHLQMIIEGDTNMLTDAEATAQAMISDSLYDKYDTEAIFAKTGTDRDNTVVRWMLNLILYYIYERIPDKLVPERVVKNYDDTLFMLLEIQDGKKGVDLPRLHKDDSTPVTKFRWGGEKRKTHD